MAYGSSGGEDDFNHGNRSGYLRIVRLYEDDFTSSHRSVKLGFRHPFNFGQRVWRL